MFHSALYRCKDESYLQTLTVCFNRFYESLLKFDFESLKDNYLELMVHVNFDTNLIYGLEELLQEEWIIERLNNCFLKYGWFEKFLKESGYKKLEKANILPKRNKLRRKKLDLEDIIETLHKFLLK